MLVTQSVESHQGVSTLRRQVGETLLHRAITATAILVRDQEMGGVAVFVRACCPREGMGQRPVLLNVRVMFQAYTVIGLQAGPTA
ncbi:hypothetical protein D3C80_217650 [compost metagenome]